MPVRSFTSLTATACRFVLVAALPGCGETASEPASPGAVDASAALDARGSTFDSSLPPIDATAEIEPDASGASCVALGGTCVRGKWANCPAGTQPVADIHSDCGTPRGNFCCVPIADAESFTCATSPAHHDCFPSSECHPCYSLVSDPSLTCPTGRTCCAYTCTD